MSEFLGVPLKQEKFEGPAVILIFLGILIDTIQMELRLPEEKLREIKALLKEWDKKPSCTKRALLRNNRETGPYGESGSTGTNVSTEDD